jgi:hypothetical protein
MYDLFLYTTQVFGAPNYIRLILTAPLEKTTEACERIVEFCMKHAKAAKVRALRPMLSTKRTVGDGGVARIAE